jgi:hypothetical protein
VNVESRGQGPNTSILILASSQSQSHNVAGRIKSIEKSNDITNLNYDLPDCNIVPQTTALLRALAYILKC